MADFNIADKLRQKNEGGFANNKADKGGETYAGIARKFWGSWKGWVVIDSIKKQHGTSAAIINKYASGNAVLKGYELEFYKTNFWYPLNLQFMNDQALANNIYDYGVNAGIDTAAKALQRASNSVCGNLTVDGQVGAKTIASVNKLDAKSVYDNFNEQRLSHYLGIVEKDPTQKQFLASWKSRIIPYQNLA